MNIQDIMQEVIPVGTILILQPGIKVGIKRDPVLRVLVFVMVETGEVLGQVPPWMSVATALETAWGISIHGSDYRTKITLPLTSK